MKVLLVSLNAKFYHTNLAIRNIKKYCEDFDIDIYEFTINDNIDFILKKIMEFHPQIIGFSCYIWNIENILDLCEYIKKIDNKIKIILGGPEASYDIRSLLKNSYINFVVINEGEMVFKNLLEYFNNTLDIKDINGIAYRKDNEIVIKPEKDYVNLDEIPFPYDDNEELSYKLVYYETSRGCPFKCSYCLSSLENKMRYESLEKVKKDLYWFSKKSVRIVKLVDRSFNSNLKRAIEILHIIKELSSDTVFHCEVNPELIDDKFIDELKGIENKIQFEAGIQTTNTKSLSEVYRNIYIKRALKGIKLLSDAHVKVHVDLIVGLPYDNFESIEKSFNDVYETAPNVIQLGFLKLLKGTKLRNEAEKYNIIYKAKPPYEILKTDDLSYKELTILKGIAFLVDKYYNSGKFTKSLKYVSGVFNKHFDFYKSFYDFWDKNYVMTKRYSLNDLYEIFYNFAKEIKNIDIELFLDLLRYDYLYSTFNKAIPKCIMIQDMPDYSKIKSLVHSDEWIKHNISREIALSNTEKTQKINIGYFYHDITNDDNNRENLYVAFYRGHNGTKSVKIYI